MLSSWGESSPSMEKQRATLDMLDDNAKRSIYMTMCKRKTTLFKTKETLFMISYGYAHNKHHWVSMSCCLSHQNRGEPIQHTKCININQKHNIIFIIF